MSGLQRPLKSTDRRLDVVLAVAGLFLAIALLPLQLFATQVYLRTLPLVLGIASGLYLFTVWRDAGKRVTGRPHLPRWAAQLLPSLVLFGVAAMVLIASLSGRTLLYYYIAAWMGILVLLQIVFVTDRDFHAGALLGQVILLALVFRLTAVYTTPGYIGVDVWTHVPNWAAAIRETGSLQPIATEKYYASPLFHLLVAVGSLLLDVSLRHGTFLTVALAMPFAVLLVYATTRFFVDARWAVFAAAVFSMSGDVIKWGIHLIPTSLGLVFFLGVVYSLTRILYLDYGVREYLLVVLFSIAIILTHQISTFIMLVFVGSALVAKLLFDSGLLKPRSPRSPLGGTRETANLAGLLVFDLGLITFMWSLTPYKGSNFLETTFTWFGSALRSSAGFLNLASGGAGGAGATTPGSPTLLEQFAIHLDAVGLLLPLFIATIGGFYVLREENASHATVTIVAAVVVILAFVFGFPLFGIRTFVPGRWVAFLVALLAIVGAIGLAYLSRRSPTSVAVAVLLLFSVAYPVTAMTTVDATQDAPVIDGVQLKHSYTERELAAAETVTDISPSDTRLYTDHPYYTVFQRTYDYPARVADTRDGDVTDSPLLYRSYHDSGAAYFERRGETPVQQSIDRQTACARRDVYYDNGAVQLCVGAGT